MLDLDGARVVIQGFGRGWLARRPPARRAGRDDHRGLRQPADRGVLCVPDVVANSGEVICAAAEHRGAGRTEAFTEIREKVHDSTAELLDRLLHAPSTPRAAADRMARERLRRALALRRKF